MYAGTFFDNTGNPVPPQLKGATFPMKLIYIFFLCCTPLLAGDWQTTEDTVVAAITNKKGLLSGLAHNHFINAGEYQMQIQADAADPLSLSIEFELKVEGLIVDKWEASGKWNETLQKWGMLEEALEKLSEDDRKSIRKKMLAKDQLNAKKFATISGSLVSITAEAGKMGAVETSHVLLVKMAIHGQEKEIRFLGNLSFEDGKLMIEAGAESLFSDFGIEPYSGMLGALANKDRFFFYLNLTAEPAS